MDTRELETYVKRSFSNATCLMGVIPALVFLYVIVVQLANFNVMSRETGLFVFISIFLLMLGMVVGRKMVWTAVGNLLEYNRKIILLQDELVESKRLSAITETTLALSHEINNPLAVISGALELLEGDLASGPVPQVIKERIGSVKTNFERISSITGKLSNLSRPVLTDAYNGAKMIDAQKSI